MNFGEWIYVFNSDDGFAILCCPTWYQRSTKWMNALRYGSFWFQDIMRLAGQWSAVERAKLQTQSWSETAKFAYGIVIQQVKKAFILGQPFCGWLAIWILLFEWCLREIEALEKSRQKSPRSKQNNSNRRKAKSFNSFQPAYTDLIAWLESGNFEFGRKKQQESAVHEMGTLPFMHTNSSSSTDYQFSCGMNPSTG